MNKFYSKELSKSIFPSDEYLIPFRLLTDADHYPLKEALLMAECHPFIIAIPRFGGLKTHHRTIRREYIW